MLIAPSYLPKAHAPSLVEPTMTIEEVIEWAGAAMNNPSEFVGWETGGPEAGSGADLDEMLSGIFGQQTTPQPRLLAGPSLIPLSVALSRPDITHRPEQYELDAVRREVRAQEARVLAYAREEAHSERAKELKRAYREGRRGMGAPRARANAGNLDRVVEDLDPVSVAGPSSVLGKRGRIQPEGEESRRRADVQRQRQQDRKHIQTQQTQTRDHAQQMQKLAMKSQLRQGRVYTASTLPSARQRHRVNPPVLAKVSMSASASSHLAPPPRHAPNPHLAHLISSLSGSIPTSVRPEPQISFDGAPNPFLDPLATIATPAHERSDATGRWIGGWDGMGVGLETQISFDNAPMSFMPSFDAMSTLMHERNGSAGGAWGTEDANSGENADVPVIYVIDEDEEMEARATVEQNVEKREYIVL